MTHLSFPETRVLGCLVEKELTTPDAYPLTLNSLTAACNQTTNREPVVAFDEKTVQEAVDGLRRKGMATALFGGGSRVQKYRHDFLEHYTLERREIALLAVLLLRGPQTPGELRQRSERMAGGPIALPEIEQLLDGMAVGDSPLVRVIPAGLGRKEKRYIHLLSGEPDESILASAPMAAPIGTLGSLQPLPPPAPSEIEALRGEIATLRQELAALREEFSAFRQQFE